MSDVREILRAVDGPATPRPGFKDQLKAALSAEFRPGGDDAGEEDAPPADIEALLATIHAPATPRPAFKRELAAVLTARLHEDGTGPSIAAPAPFPVTGTRRGVMERLRTTWWLQSAAAASVVVLALIGSGTAWNSCLREGEPGRSEAAAPEAPSDRPSGPGGGGGGAPGNSDPGAPANDGGRDPQTPGGPGPVGGAPVEPGTPPEQPPPALPDGDPAVLAFASKTDDYWHIFTMNEDGTERVQLTHGAAHDRGPSWSPDGRRIAFMRLTNEDSHMGEIFVMNADGSGLRFLAEGGEPAWSPDGKQIVYATGTPPAIAIVNADGSGARSVRVAGLAAADPYWSPDGDRISFAGFGVVNAESEPPEQASQVTNVFSMRPDGSSVRRLTDEPWACNMSFSPDGSRIAYTQSDDYRNYNVWTMDADGSDKRQLTSGAGVRAFPHWSPDGQRIVFAFDPDGEEHWAIFPPGPAPSAIWVMNADGTGLHRVSPPDVDDADPAFAP